MNGLALVEGSQPGWKQIVPADDLMAISGPAAETMGPVSPGRVITQVFRLQHTEAARIEQILQPAAIDGKACAVDIDCVSGHGG